MPARIAPSAERLLVADEHRSAAGLLTDIAKILYDYKPTAVYEPLVAAACRSILDCANSLNFYEAHKDSERLNRDLIGAVMDFVQQWDDWYNSLENCQLKHASSKMFHSYLLRYAKGALKAWRCWRIDLRK